MLAGLSNVTGNINMYQPYGDTVYDGLQTLVRARSRSAQGGIAYTLSKTTNYADNGGGNAPGAGAYPISSFTWLLLYETPKDLAQSKVMVDFMKWALADGQKFAAGLGYAPLPASVVQLELSALEKVKTS